jgi:hypothetical protein
MDKKEQLTNEKFVMPNYIYNLDMGDIFENLFHYQYKIKHLNSIKDTNSPAYLGAYSGFKGELYENVIYELLLKYAQENKQITKFILKGPHQDNSKNTNEKTGLLIDKNSQIVYRAGYKDISEFDALFFTKTSVFFMESTIVQGTISLRRRLLKKHALMKIIFPNLQIKALIILVEGVFGASKFPPYATVWKTKELDGRNVLAKLTSSYKKLSIKTPKSNNYEYAVNIITKPFRYFNVLQWILNNAIKDKSLNKSFLQTAKNKLHFHICKKIYLGYTSLEIVKEANFDFDFKGDLDIYVSLERLDNGFFEIYYYGRENEKTSLMKIDLTNKNKKAIIAKKDYKGFTVSEVKFIKYVLKKRHFINLPLLLTIIKSSKELGKVD